MPTTTTVVCPVPGHNHSNDQLTIYHGRAEPLLVCGFHHQMHGTTHLVDLARNEKAV